MDYFQNGTYTQGRDAPKASTASLAALSVLIPRCWEIRIGSGGHGLVEAAYDHQPNGIESLKGTSRETL